jgi:uridine kinase
MQISEAAYPGLDELIGEIRRRMVGRAAPLLVALDGRSGTGKSTLAALLADRLGATVVEGDDFYPGGSDADWDARSPAEKAALVIDWRRMRADALEPLLAGRPAAWHPFDFAAGEGLAAHTVTRAPAPVIVLDGVYSARPELADLVDLAILVEAADDRVRRQRLLAREGAPYMAAWHRRWDAAEDYYFTHVRPRSSFDRIITSV